MVCHFYHDFYQLPLSLVDGMGYNMGETQTLMSPTVTVTIILAK